MRKQCGNVIELIGGPLDGAVINVPRNTTTVTVTSGKARLTTERTYTIQFDDRQPLRALYVVLYPGDEGK